MNCQEFLHRLDKFVEAKEDMAPPPAGMEHIDECPECKGIYEQHILLGRRIRALPKACAPQGLADKVMASVPASARKRVLGVRLPKLQTIAAVAAALALFVLPLNAMLNQERPFVALSDSAATIQVEGRNIVVPSGVNVRGDIKVVNGHLTVFGSVEGNITLIRSVLVSGPEARIGSVYTVDWTLWQQISYSVTQFAQDVRSYARGMWR
jgi:hypothetical protein